jgi:hypothetical protein
MEYTKQQIKLARRFFRRYKKKIYDAREKTVKDSRDKYLIKRARFSIKIVNWARQKGLRWI